jgi:predicted transport protein
MDVDKALQTMIDNMPEKTGKSLDEWKTVLSKESFEKHMQGVNFLKKTHGVTHGFANTIVKLYTNDQEEVVDLVQAQYAGKEVLKPIYEAVTEFIATLGSDITTTPKKSSVSIIRKRQFALIKPATKTRIDLGLKIKDKPVGGKLEGSGPFGTMCTHRIKLTSTEDFDQEVQGYIKEAYEASV